MSTVSHTYYAPRGDYVLHGMNQELGRLPLTLDAFVDFQASRRNDGVLLSLFYSPDRPLFLQVAAPDDASWFLKNGFADHVDLIFSAPVDKSTVVNGTFTWYWEGGSEAVDAGDVEYSEEDRQLRVLAPTLPADYVGSLSLVFADIDSAQTEPLQEPVTLHFDILEDGSLKPQPGTTSAFRPTLTGYLGVGRLVVPFGQSVPGMMKAFLTQKALDKERVLKVIQLEGPNKTVELFLLWWQTTSPKILSLSPRSSGTVSLESPPDAILLQFDQPIPDPSQYFEFDDVPGTDLSFAVTQLDDNARQWRIAKSGGLFASEGQHTLKIVGLPNIHGDLAGPPVLFSWQVLPLEAAGGGVSDHGALTGLGDDDHPQYHNDARGDVRYAPIAKGVTNGDTHDHSGGDGGQIDHGGLAGLSDDDHPQYTRADGTRAFTGDQSMGGFRLTNVLAPSGALDAANKAYVDAIAEGLDPKASVLVASTGSNLTLSGEQTIDGVLTSASRVLVKDQTAPAENGIYVTAAGAWARAADADTWTELISAFVFVEQGAVNGDNGWLCTVDLGGVLGVDPVTWVQFSGAGQIVAGAALTKTGNQLDVAVDDSTIEVSSDALRVKDAGITDAKLRDSAALSVIGRSANSSGVPADIAAGSDGFVLRRAGTNLGFGTVATAGIADDAVTYAKLQNISATQRVLGRNSSGAGDAEEVTIVQFLEWLSSTQGAIATRSTSAWAALAPSSIALKPLVSNGTGANLSYSGGPYRGVVQGRLNRASAGSVIFQSMGQGRYIEVNDELVSIAAGLTLTIASDNALSSTGTDSGVQSNASNTTWYCYISDSGVTWANQLRASTTAPSLVNGIYYLNTSGQGLRWRYVGMYRTDGGGTIPDDDTQVRVASFYNQITRRLFTCPAYTDDNAITAWTTGSTTWTQANTGTGSSLFFLSHGDRSVHFQAHAWCFNSVNTNNTKIGIGLDSITDPTVIGSWQGSAPNHIGCSYDYLPTNGFHQNDLLCMVTAGLGTYRADDARNGAAVDPYATYLEAWVWI